MRSAELASLSGVTVRTLRHYHQLGVLAEPPRSVNGYREYDVADLIRVLRVKRLSAIGIPLERMPQLLDSPEHQTDSTLEQLDAELAAEIDRLTARRALIAELRTRPAVWDAPPQLAPFLFTAQSTSPWLARIDHEQSVLLAHFLGTEGVERLRALYETLSAPDVANEYARISERFEALGDATTPAEEEQLVNDLADAYAHLDSGYDDLGSFEELGAGPASGLVEDYIADTFNAAQQRVLARAGERFAASKGDTSPD